MNVRIDMKNIIQYAMVTFLAVLLLVLSVRPAYAATEPTPVEITSIDYEDGTILLKKNGNNKVYFSTSSKKTWITVDCDSTSDVVKFDISWISVGSACQLNFKGDKNTELETVVLPRYYSSYTVKYDKVNEELDFSKQDNRTSFQWRKRYAMTWKTVDTTNATQMADFKKEIEKFTSKGTYLQIRLPQVIGTSAENPGLRPSKTVTVRILARRSAPGVYVSASSMRTNTSSSYEYSYYSKGGTVQTLKWTQCDKSMYVEDMAPEVLNGTSVVMAVRRAPTTKYGPGKVRYLNIPGQRTAPAANVVSVTKTEKSYKFQLSSATSSEPYQYAVVAAGKELDEKKLKWKTVTSSSKSYVLSSRSYPAGSKLLVRQAGFNKSTKRELLLPSKYVTIEIAYEAPQTTTQK